MRARIRCFRGHAVWGAGLAALLLNGPLFASEVVVQNDNSVNGQAVGLCPCFVQGEEAAAWLTSPCNGTLVAVQIFWGSLFGGGQPTVENSILIYSSGAFPAPGAIMTNAGSVPAVVASPTLGVGGLNEFRFLEPSHITPLSVPIAAGQTFVVSLRFQNNQGILSPSVAWDCNTTGSPCVGQCQAGRNAIFAIPGGWTNLCTSGGNGDWIIRAVINCQPANTCPADIDHNGQVNVDDLLAVISAWGPCNNCPPDIHPPPDGNNQVNVDDLLLVISSWGPCP